MTASRHLIGKDSLIISRAVSINLEEGRKEDEEEEFKKGKGKKGAAAGRRGPERKGAG